MQIDKYQLEKLVIDVANFVSLSLGKKEGPAVVGGLVVALILRLEEMAEIGGFWDSIWSRVGAIFGSEED